MWAKLVAAWHDEQRVMLWLAQVAIASLPFSMSLNAIAVGLLLANWLLRPGVGARVAALLRNRLFYWLTLPFWILVVSALWGSDWAENLSLLRITLPLLVLPMVVVGTNRLAWPQVRLLCYTLMITCLAAGLVMLPVGVYRWMQTDEVKHLFYHDLASSIELHSIYLSQCVSLGIVTAVYMLLFDSTLPSGHRSYLRMATVLLAVLLLMLASRMVIGVSLLTLLSVLYVYLQQRYGPWRSIAAVIITGGCMVMLTWQVPYVRDRVNKLLIYDTAEIDKPYFQTGEQLKELPLRVVLLQHSVKSLNEQQCWLWGHGLSDGQAAMDVYMQQRNLLRYVGMNPHNLYMHYVLLAGLLGLGVYVLGVVSWLWLAWVQSRHLFMVVLGMMLLFGMTESLYFRQQAVVLYSLVVAVLLHCQTQPTMRKSTSV